MKLFSHKYILLLLLMAAFVVVPHSAAQQELQDATCEALVDEVLVRVERVCEGLGRNEACYGNERVNARFATGRAYEFSQPADRVPLGDLSSLTTFPLDVEHNLWGVAMMNVQANLPDTFAGQGVLFVLYGDVTLENAGREQRTDVPFLDGIIKAEGPVNMRSGPGYDYNVIDLAMPGAEVVVEGRSEDGQWVLANVDSISAWIAVQFVELLESNVETLAVRNPAAAYGPMQAFYLTTGVGQPECRDVPPSSLVIQSPEGYVINLSVNGVNVNIASTVALTTTEEMMSITTLEGGASMSVGSFSSVVPTGFTAEIPLRRDDRGALRPAGPPKPPKLIDPVQAAPVANTSTVILEQPVVVPKNSTTNVEEFCADPANAALCGNPGIATGSPVCGDNICSAGEYCPSDCGGGTSGGGQSTATCGDNFCDPIFLGETAGNCPADCGGTVSICGDYVCNAATGENATTCAFDCVPHQDGPLCGDNTCDLAGGETSESCPADCSTNLGSNLGVPINSGVSDGGGAIGTGQTPISSPGSTAEVTAPVIGQTEEATPAVTPPSEVTSEATADATSRPAPECGDGICVPGEICSADCGESTESGTESSSGSSSTSPASGYCGDLICGLGEDSSICPSDCGEGTENSSSGSFATELPISSPSSTCGDLICGLGEDGNSCPGDCGAPPPPNTNPPAQQPSTSSTEESSSGSGTSGSSAGSYGSNTPDVNEQPTPDTSSPAAPDDTEAALPREEEITHEP